MNIVKERYKYKKLLDFIREIRTDGEMSKYLFIETKDLKKLNEYKYNKNLYMCASMLLDKTKYLKELKVKYDEEEGSFEQILNRAGMKRSSFYRRLDKEYNYIVNQIYRLEDILYDKYITNGEVNYETF